MVCLPKSFVYILEPYEMRIISLRAIYLNQA